ncbi:hypothetical protein MNB_SM-4-342 [hydrothermal vent metagenome]|uniref:PpiC domain-containing protein n=1 Tax=hydrothermal vent metagenome TaxID=652676 RepID=A0A1W1BLA8_9ZZZZ
MAAFLKEPLFHFLIIGSLLFFFLHDTDVLPNELIITDTKIQQLSSQFNKTYHREASKKELAALVDDYLKDLIAFKKGQEMHLIEDDSIIQRRVRQKVEFILESSIATLSPSDEELHAFMKKHQNDFMNEARYSFTQVYIDENKHRNIDTYIQELLSKLDTADISTLGDNLMLETTLTDVSSSEIKRVFGQKFLLVLEKIEVGKWLEVPSGYGLHLVKIQTKTARSLGDLEQNRYSLAQAYILESQKNALKEFYRLEKKNLNVHIGDN